jgi:glucokinase
MQNMTGSEYVLGVDVGGTSIRVSRMNRDCAPQKIMRSPTDTANQIAIIESIYNAIEKYLAEETDKPSSIGMGLVGHINSRDGIWENAINIRINDPVDIRSDILRRFGVPVFIDNDVKMATLAEMIFGAGKIADDFIFINIGTGIAAGIVSERRIIKGVCNYAGEIGHMLYGDKTRTCKCGRKGCVEPSLSGGGIVNIAKEKAAANPGSSFARLVNAGAINSGLVFREAEKGDPIAQSIAEFAMQSLECMVVDLVNLLNPALVVFGGGAVESGFVLNRLTEHVYQNALPVAKKGLKGIQMSNLDPALVGLIGAACAAWTGFDGI